MKHRLWIVLLACVCLLGCACQNGKKKNTPEAVTEAFAKAFYTGDFTHMYQYANKKSQIVIKTMQDGMKDQTDRLDAMHNAKVEFESITVDDLTDSTAMSTTHTLIDGKPLTGKWDLVKEDDQWKVTMVMP